MIELILIEVVVFLKQHKIKLFARFIFTVIFLKAIFSMLQPPKLQS